MELLHKEKVSNSSRLEKIRSFFLLALLSTFSLSSCSQDEQCVQDKQIVAQDSLYRSILLDTTPALDKSILYYHIAKDKEGTIDICESVERVLSYREWLVAIADTFGVPLDTALALMLTESRGLLYAKSSVWAAGPWQIMPNTAKQYDKNYAWWKAGDKRFDLERSSLVAMKELSRNYNELQDWSLAFAAYHMGIGNIRKLRALYQQTMCTELCSFDQLYATIPSKEIIDWLASKNDDTFWYWIKIRNAITLLRLFQEDRRYFDYLESEYRSLSYDVRGVVAENIDLEQVTHLQTHNDVQSAINLWLLQELDHGWFVCGNYDFEHFLHKDAQWILDIIRTMYGNDVHISCGLLPKELLGDAPTIINKNQTIRLAAHTTGKSFDIQAPANSYSSEKKRIVGWSDYNRLEMVLTSLRYQWKIVWCGETDPDKKTILHFHITILSSDK